LIGIDALRRPNGAGVVSNALALAVSMQIVGSEPARDSEVKIAFKQASYTDYLTTSCSRATP
jgi:hypothetical protein